MSSHSLHSRTSSRSKKSVFSSSIGGGSENANPLTNGSTDRAGDEDSIDSEAAVDMIVGSGMMQKIESLKQRRRSDRKKILLTAAARGDLEAVKKSLKVCSYCAAMKRTFCDFWFRGRRILV